MSYQQLHLGELGEFVIQELTVDVDGREPACFSGVCREEADLALVGIESEFPLFTPGRNSVN